MYFGYKSVIAAVSAEEGVELLQIQNHAVNHIDFGRYLGRLSLSNDQNPFALFLDNLAVHKHDIVKKMYDRLQIHPIFNIPYSPETNPIETCFSLVKHYFVRKRLQCLANDLPFDINATIGEAFD